MISQFEDTLIFIYLFIYLAIVFSLNFVIVILVKENDFGKKKGFNLFQFFS